MKRFVYIILVCLVASGCRRYLDVKPQGKVLPKTEDEYAAVLNYRLNNIESGAYDEVIGSGNTICLYEGFADDLNANIAVGNLPIYAGTEFNKHFSLYKDWYAVIKDCNIIIGAMKEKDSDHARQLVAAATGMKGVCYYNLLRNYCKAYNPQTALDDLGLCIVDHFDMAEAPARSDLKTTAAYIVSVLKESIGYGISDGKYLFTADVVKAYLAKTYFWMQDWSSALGLCTELAETYGLTPRTEYAAMINAEYEKKPGVIVRSRINDNNYASAMIRKQAVSDLLSRPVNVELIKLFAPYNEKDIRYGTSFTSQRKNAKEPVAKVREGEIFLMMAECQAHLNNTAEALEILNEIRSERIEGYVPYTMETLPEVNADAVIKSDATGKPLSRLMQAILNERRMEMYLEGDRWFELKRNGSPEFWVITDDVVYRKYTTKSYMYTFPINKDDVELKDYIIQNEGYVEYL